MSTARTNREEILSVVGEANNLPTLPDIMFKVKEVTRNPEASAGELVSILEEDPAIISAILKTVNSAMYAPFGSSGITDIHQAVTRLGFREVENIALSTSVLKATNNLPGRLFNRREFWKHCICTACLSVNLSYRMDSSKKLPAAELHLGGLTHDLGRLLLEAYFPDKLESCLKKAHESELPLFEAERKLLGLDHAEVGELLADRWRLPESAQQVLAFHHAPTGASESNRILVSLVHLANYLVNTRGLGIGGDEAWPALKNEAWEIAGLSSESAEEAVNEVANIENELMDILRS